MTVMAGCASSASNGPQVAMSLTSRAVRSSFRTYSATGIRSTPGRARRIAKRVIQTTSHNLPDSSWLGDELKEWVRRNWFDVVGSGDVKHYKAGTRVDKLHSRQGAFSYASKRYVSKASEVEKLNLKPGRFWGVFNRKHLPLGQRQTYRLTRQQAVQLRRYIRRHRRATTQPENRRWLHKGSSSDAANGFTVKHYCRADFWLERLPKLIGALPKPHAARPANAVP